jgi:hypothetical protein
MSGPDDPLSALRSAQPVFLFGFQINILTNFNRGASLYPYQGPLIY